MIAESDVSADPAARRLATRLLQQGAQLERLIRLPRTVVVVHRLRVLTRRMRAACSVTKRLAPAEAVRELARRLRRLGRALGDRRTFDVAADDYAALSGGRTHPDIERARAAAESKLVKRLRAKHRDAILAALQTAVDALRSSETDPESLDRFLKTRMNRLRECLGASSKEELHALRIEAKKTRYALETARLMGRRGRRNGEAALRNLQRRLGRIHDLESLRALIPVTDPVSLRAAAREAVLRAGVRPLADRVRSPLGGNGRAS